jgi:hypothetical protein
MPVSTKPPRATRPTQYARQEDPHETEAERLARRASVRLLKAAVRAQLLRLETIQN